MLDAARVAYWLALFGERVGRTLSSPTYAEYHRALEQAGVTTPEFEGAARRLYDTETFLPPPGRFVEMARPKSKAPVSGLISKIEQLGSYSPNGWRYPQVDRVAASLGAAAAYAYGQVGSSNLYSDNPTTRSIAEREFAQYYQGEVESNPDLALPAPSHPKLLGSGEAESDDDWIPATYRRHLALARSKL